MVRGEVERWLVGLSQSKLKRVDSGKGRGVSLHCVAQGMYKL